MSPNLSSTFSGTISCLVIYLKEDRNTASEATVDKTISEAIYKGLFITTYILVLLFLLKSIYSKKQDQCKPGKYN